MRRALQDAPLDWNHNRNAPDPECMSTQLREPSR